MPSSRSIVANPSGAAAGSRPWQPAISVVIPVRNEETHIEEAVRSALEQHYPAELLEVIVADGLSTDGTGEILNRLASEDRRLRIVDNPGRNQAAGLNRAIAVAGGEVIARLDGHAAWKPWHLRTCIEVLERTNADNVGGTMEGASDSVIGMAVARASGSRFGVGAARYRYGRSEFETDTVFLGCFRRSALERVGEFNERMAPHEDYELNLRIRTSGGRIVFSPEIPTRYYTRTTWRALMKQFFRYGRAKSRVSRVAPKVLRPHHFVPPMALAVASLLSPTLATARGRRAASAVGTIYVGSCLGAGLRATRGQPVGVRLLTPIVFPLMHGAWGLGFWVGLFSPTRE